MSPRTRSRLTAAVWTTGALATALAVGLGGELSPAAHVAVLAAGTVVVGVGLVRRVGDGSPPAGRTARVWLVLLALAVAAEAVALTHDGVPTASDLLDPVLASFAARTAATLGWLGIGVRLVTRPGSTLGAAMRTTVGRVSVLAAWLWVGLHFLAR